MALSRADNAYWCDHGYHHGEVVLRNLPEVCAIESTNYCNIKCIMCPRGEPDVMTRALGHMDNALFRRILDQAAFFSEPCWFHWFGEPLLNPRLFDQIALAKQRIPNLGISTNATLLHARHADQILDSGLDTLLIAIDGATKEVYERTRKGPFAFEMVRDNILQFLARKRQRRQHRPRAILSIIVMDSTESDLEAFRTYWTAHGADEVLFKPFVNWAGQDTIWTQLAVRGQRAAFHSPRAHPCKLLWKSVVIAWDGRVVPCCYDYDARMALGDLKTQSLAEIWNGPAYMAVRRAELAGCNDSALCANCSQGPGHARDPNWGGPVRVEHSIPLPVISVRKAG
jgi:radical SAM protein with 4Fe4S-binding SPASM domain